MITGDISFLFRAQDNNIFRLIPSNDKNFEEKNSSKLIVEKFAFCLFRWGWKKIHLVIVGDVKNMNFWLDKNEIITQLSSNN